MLSRIKIFYSKFNSFLTYFSIIFNNLFNKFLDILKLKKLRLIEQAYFSRTYFKRILRKEDYYLKNFKKIFYSNNPFYYIVNDVEREKSIIFLDNELNGFKNYVLNQADLILSNKYEILGKKYQFKEKVKWNYSFTDDFYWPFKRSKEINYIYEGTEDIDIKYALRLNYHEEFITLGLAYYLTTEEKYAKKFIDLILEWVRINPPNFGINWIDSLEISHRIISWIISFSFFKNSETIKNTNFDPIAKSLSLQVFFIKANTSKKSYNHVIGENYAIYLFSNIFKEIRTFKKFYHKSKLTLIKQIKRQIQEDGAHIEQASSYHRLILEIFSFLLIIEPLLFSIEHLHYIEKMFYFLKFLIKPDGTLPLIGDSDDSHFIPLIFAENDDKLNDILLDLGSLLFKQPDLKLNDYYYGASLILFFLGSDKFQYFKKIKKSPSSQKIRYFSKSGYLIGKSDWSNSGNYLVFDMGHFGTDIGAHDHSDISNIIYSYRGKPILVDSGTYMYNLPLKKISFFRSAKAHNVITIDHQNQANLIDRFLWNDIPQVKRKCFIKNHEINAYVEHTGYQGFATHRKIRFYNDLNNLFITDIITPIKIVKKYILISSKFHFSNEIPIEIKDNEIIIDSNLSFKIKVDNSENSRITKKFFPYSPKYGLKLRSNFIEVLFKHMFENREELKICYFLSQKI